MGQVDYENNDSMQMRQALFELTDESISVICELRFFRAIHFDSLNLLEHIDR